MSVNYRSVFHSDLFSGCRVMITGGGSGIGRCVAHELASLGAEVLLAGRTRAKLEAVVSEIRADGGSARSGICDVRDEEAVEEIVAEFAAEGAIHALVNCAGGQFPALLSEMSTKGFDAVIRNNLIATFTVSRAVFDACMRDNGGAIVNITADTPGGMPLMGHTGAARAGVENLTATAALEWARHGIRVNAVAPGYVISSGFDTYSDERMINAFSSFGECTPLGRLGTESEVSAAVVFLLSPAASFIDGQVLRVDGGFGLKTRTPMLALEVANSYPAFEGFHRSVLPGVLAEEDDD